MKNSTFMSRLISLTRKETRQLLRDKSNLAVGLLLPVVLILLFGYGLSFDLNNARIAVVQEQRTPQSWQIVTALQGSRYLSVQEYTNLKTAQDMLRKGETDAILRIPPDFAQRLTTGNAQLQLLLNGASTSVASAAQEYVTPWPHRRPLVLIAAEASLPPAASPLNSACGLTNPATVPGLVVLILTLIGAFLTGLFIAREHERGTLEALFVTPVRPLELVLAKLAPYMVVGAIDLVICLLAAHYLFEQPVRGSASRSNRRKVPKRL